MHSWWQHCHPRNSVHALHALPTFHLGSYLARLPATLLPILQAVLSGEIVETSECWLIASPLIAEFLKNFSGQHGICDAASRTPVLMSSKTLTSILHPLSRPPRQTIIRKAIYLRSWQTTSPDIVVILTNPPGRILR